MTVERLEIRRLIEAGALLAGTVARGYVRSPG